MTYTYAYIIKNIYMNIYIHTELFFVFVYRMCLAPNADDQNITYEYTGCTPSKCVLHMVG